MLHEIYKNIILTFQPLFQGCIAAAEIVAARFLPPSLQDALEVASAGAIVARHAAARSQEDSG